VANYERNESETERWVNEIKKEAKEKTNEEWK
jgi:hypothetical protein